ncbi:hypothetical protein [Trueperella bialowiezensis]|uniref:hypothetical protein n=1 Tax=Trueperella bialowiezensis TaxID=312285 RepID=UPI000F8167EE|nr:hypothetical protein [Trueperella bialowiezensis]
MGGIWGTTAVKILAGAVGAGLVILLVYNFLTSKLADGEPRPDPLEKFEHVACDPQNLAVTVDRSGTQAGQPVAFTANIKNTGSRPCYFDAADLHLRIESGDQTIYDTSACEPDRDEKMLLLDTQLETAQSLHWNGMNTGPLCTAANPAKSGTYVARLFLNSAELLDSGLVMNLGGGAYEPAASDPGEESEDSETTKSADAETSDTEARGTEGSGNEGSGAEGSGNKGAENEDAENEAAQSSE